MKQILGMAKSCLDLKGSKPRNLELDFARLAFAVSKTRAEKREAHGFLLVLRAIIQKRAEGWKTKYGVTNEIEVILAQTTPAEDRILEKEKASNARGNKASPAPEDASARESQLIGEKYLQSEIKKRFSGVKEQAPDLPHLKCVKWDFCGVVIDETKEVGT